MSYWLLAEGLLDQHDRLKDRIVHVETLLQRGRWLWQNDNTDLDGAYYLWIDKIDERDTYYSPVTQFKATACGEDDAYLCFESISLPRRYLTAGFPAEASKYTVKLQSSTYINDDNRFHWEVMCEDETLGRCKFIPVRFKSDGYMMVADNWGSIEAERHEGHYDATLGKDESQAWFRVLAPNPSDHYIDVYENVNCGDVDQTVTYTATVGVTQTKTTTNTITTSVSMEIGASFKAFSASISATIDKSWQFAESSAFQKSKSVAHELTLPAHKKVVLSQLTGDYADQFKVGDDKYIVDLSEAECGA